MRRPTHSSAVNGKLRALPLHRKPRGRHRAAGRVKPAVESLETRALLTALTPGEQSALINGLLAVDTFGSNLSATGPLASSLPIVDMSLGQVLDVGKAVGQGLTDPAQGYLASTASATAEGLASALDTTTSVTVAGLTLSTTPTVTVILDPSGNAVDATVTLAATTSQNTSLDLGPQAASLSLTTAGAQANVAGTLALGFDLVARDDGTFTFREHAAPLSVSATVAPTGPFQATVNGTTLAATVASFTENPAVAIALGDPHGDGTLTQADLNASDPAPLATFTPSGVLDGQIALAGSLPGLARLGNASIRIADQNPFNAASPDVSLVTGNLDSQITGALSTALGDLNGYGGSLLTGNALDTPLPVVNKSLNDLLSNASGTKIGDFFDLQAGVQSLLGGGSVSLAQVLQGLEQQALGLAGVSSTSGTLTDGPIEVSGGLDPSSQSLVLHTVFDLGRTVSVPIDLGTAAAGLGLSLDASANVTFSAHLNLDLTFGISLANFENGQSIGDSDVYLQVNGAEVKADIDASDLNFGARVGFLQAGVAGGSAQLDATADLVVAKPDGTTKITLADLKAPGVTPASFVHLSFPQDASTPATVNALHVLLPLRASLGGVALAGGTAGAGPSLRLDSNDIFGGTAPTFSSDLGELGDFSTITPGQILSLFDRIQSVLTQFSGSPAFNVPVPLTGKTVGDLIDLGTSFANNLLAPLQAVGDASITATADLPADYRMTSPAVFGLSIDGGAPVQVTVPETTSAAPQTIDDLLNAVRGALVRTGINAEVLIGHDGNRITLIRPGSDLARSLKVVAPSGSAVDALHLSDGQVSTTPTGNVPTPLFSTVQDLITLLEEELGIDPTVLNVQFDANARQLTFHLHWSDSFRLASVPLNLNLPLGDLANVSTSSQATLGATAGIDLGVGIGLASNAAPQITGQPVGAVPSSGVLPSDAHFTITPPGSTTPVLLTVTAASTAGDNAIVNANDANDPHSLVGAINAAIAGTPALAGRVIAGFSGGVIHFKATSDGSSLVDYATVGAPGNGALFEDIHFTITPPGAASGTTIDLNSETTSALNALDNPANPYDPTTLVGAINAAIAATPLRGTVLATGATGALQFLYTSDGTLGLAVPSNGRLNNDLTVQVTLGQTTSATFLVPASTTSGNTTPSDFVGQINAAIAADARFSGNVQATLIDGVVRFVLSPSLAPPVAAPNAKLSSDLNLTIQVGPGAPAVTLTVPAYATTTNTAVSNPANPSDPKTLVGDINAAISANPALAGRVLALVSGGQVVFTLNGTLAPSFVPPTDGVLAGDLAFQLVLGPFVSPETITVKAADTTNPTQPDQTSADLVNLVNQAIAADPVLAGSVQAVLDNGSIVLQTTGDAQTAGTPLTVVSHLDGIRSALSDPAFAQLGLPGDGVLPADATFRVSLDGNAPVDVTVPQGATADNTSLFNPADPNDATTLVGDINAALAAAGLGGAVTADAVGNRVRLTAGASSTSLKINVPAGDPLATLLGFVDGATSHAQSKPTLFLDTGQVLSGGVTLDASVDATAQLGPVVLSASGGTAHVSAGLTATIQDPADPGATTIDIVTLANDLSSIKATDLVNGSPNSPLSLNVNGNASFGLNGISVNGLSLLSGQNGNPALSVSLPTLLLPATTLDLQPDGSGRIADTAHFTVTLGDGATASVAVNPSETKADHAMADLAAVVQADINKALAAAGSSDTVTVSVDADGIRLDLASSATPTGPVKVTKLVLTDLGPLNGLGDLSNLSFTGIIEDLQQVVDALAPSQAQAGSSAFGFLDTPIPGIGISAAQVVDYAGMFAHDLDSLTQNPGGTLDQLQSDLQQALGVNIPLTLGFDPTTHVLTVGLDDRFDISEQTALSLDIPALENLLPDSLASVKSLLGQVSTLVGLGVSANLGVQAYADLNLKLGIDLTNPLAPKPFIDDATGITLGLKASASKLNFSASAGPFGITIKDGSIDLGDPNAADGFAKITLGLTDFDGSGRHFLFGNGALSQIAHDFHVGLTGSLVATLPVYAPTPDFPLGGAGHNDLIVNVGDIQAALKGAKGSVLIQTPDFSHLAPSLLSLITNPSVVVDGVDSALGALQSGLNSQVLDQNLPLIGSQLQQGAQFVQSIRDGIIAQLRADLAGVNGAVALQQELYKLFQGLGLLYTPDDATLAPATIPTDPVVLNQYVSLFQNDPTNPTSIELRLHLHQALGQFIPSVPFGFDIGLPGLGLSLGGASPIFNIGWDFNLGLGIDTSKGLYLITGSNTDGTAAHTFQINVGVSLPNTTLSGQIGYLELTAATDPDTAHNPTDLAAQFQVDVSPSSGTAAADPNGGSIIPLSSLLSGLKLTPGFGAHADVNLDLSAGFGQGSVFPHITTMLHLQWGFGNQVSTAYPSTPAVEFRDVTLDLGSFISQFVGPIVQQVKTYLDPIKPIVDVLSTRLPVISDLEGHDVTLVDLASQLGFGGPSASIFIKAFETIYSVIDSVPTDSGDLKLNFGTLNFADTSMLTHPFNPNATTLPDTESTADVGSMLSADGASQSTRNFAAKVTHTADFTLNFPLLSKDAPKILFGLLTGKTEDLFQFDLTKLQIGFNYRQVFPIVWPLSATLDGSISATLHLAFGYDTTGVQEAIRDKNNGPAAIATDLLDGFYIDTNPAGGPQIALDGGIAAGAALSLEIATGGIEGGIFAHVQAALQDIHPDHKLRYGDIVRLITDTSGNINPLYLFDISGDLTFRLYAYINVTIPPINYSYDIIPPITLLSFHLPPHNVAPQLGSESYDPATGATVLTLNMGPNASRRGSGDTADDNEHFLVQAIPNDNNPNPGTQDVEIEYFDANGNPVKGPDGQPLIEKHYGISRIVAGTGAGNNELDLSGIAIPSTITAGGNDAININGGSGGDTINLGGGYVNLNIGAGSNNESIIGGAGGATIVVPGDDTSIKGGAGSLNVTAAGRGDTIAGGAGDDTISATGDGDVVSGGGGSNVLNLTGQDATLAEAGMSSFVLAPGSLQTSSGYDTFGTLPATIVLTGTRGPDTFDVSAWNVSGPSVSLVGAGGDDTIIDNQSASAQPVTIQLSNASLMHTIAGGSATVTLQNIDRAVLNGGAGADTIGLAGFSGSATLVGGGGADAFSVESDPGHLPSVSVQGTPGSGSSLVVKLDAPAGGSGTSTVSTSGVADVTLDDSADNQAASWGVRASSVSLGSHAILQAAGASHTTLTFGPGDGKNPNTVDVVGLWGPTTINAGPGATNLVVGRGPATLGGVAPTLAPDVLSASLASVGGPLTIAPTAGALALTFDDSIDTAALGGTLSTATVAGGTAGVLSGFGMANPVRFPSNLAGLTIDLGPDASSQPELTVIGTTSPLTVVGNAGGDTIRVTGAGAPVTVDGAGADTLVVDRTADTADRATASLSATEISGLGTAAIDYNNLIALRLLLGSGAVNLSVPGTIAAQGKAQTTINFGSGGDSATVTSVGDATTVIGKTPADSVTLDVRSQALQPSPFANLTFSVATLNVDHGDATSIAWSESGTALLADGSLLIDTQGAGATNLHNNGGAADILTLSGASGNLDAPETFLLHSDATVNLAQVTQGAQVLGGGAFVPSSTLPNTVNVSGLYFVSRTITSPDGRFFYAASTGESAISVFRKNPTTGNLDELQAIHEGDVSGGLTVQGLSNVFDVAMSPDGSTIYAAGNTGSDIGVSVFRRDAVTGALAFIQSLTDADQFGAGASMRFNTATSVVVSPEGDQVILAGTQNSMTGLVATFRRDPSTGLLSAPAFYAFAVDQYQIVERATLSPDGSQLGLSLASGTTGSFRVIGRINQPSNPNYGVLVFSQYSLESGTNPVVPYPLSGNGSTPLAARSMVISADGRFAYALFDSGTDGLGTVNTYVRDPATGLFEEQLQQNTTNGNIGDSDQILLSGDGRFLFAAGGGTGHNIVNVFSRDTATGILTYLYYDRIDGYTAAAGATLYAGGAAVRGDTIFVAGTDGAFVYGLTPNLAAPYSAPAIETIALPYNTINPSPYNQTTGMYRADVAVGGNLLFVSSDYNRSLYVVTLNASNQVVAESIDGTSPTLDAIVASPDGSEVFGIPAGTGIIYGYRVNGSGNSITLSGLGSISSGAGAYNLAVSPDGKRLVTTSLFTPGVAVVDLSGGGFTLATQINLGSDTSPLSSGTALRGNPTAAAIAPDGTFYVAGYSTYNNPYSVPVIDVLAPGASPAGAHFVQVQPVNFGGVAMTGPRSIDSATATTDGTPRFYIPDVDGNLLTFGPMADGTYQPIEFLTNGVSFLNGDAVRGLGGAYDNAVSPDGKQLYVVGSNDVAVFTRDPATGLLTGEPQIVGGAGDPVAAAALSQGYRIAVSQDGQTVYVTTDPNDHVVELSRDPATGLLTLGASLTDGPEKITPPSLGSVVITPDGGTALAADPTDGAIVAVARDPATGQLSASGAFPYQVVREGQAVNGSIPAGGLYGVAAMALSDDGTTLYAVSPLENAITVLGVSFANGKPVLTPLQTLYNVPTGSGQAGIPGLQGADAVAVSPDGRDVYVAGKTAGSLVILRRDATTGLLTATVPAINGLSQPDAVTVTPDGTTVLVAEASGSLLVYNRNLSDGSLALAQTFSEGQNVNGLVLSGLAGANAIAVSPDGATVVAAGPNDRALAVFGRDPTTGRLTPTEVINDASGIDGLAGANALAFSPVYSSGDATRQYLFVSGGTSNAVAVFGRDARPTIPAPSDPSQTIPNPGFGQIVFLQRLANGAGGVQGLQGPNALAVGPTLAGQPASDLFLYVSTNGGVGGVSGGLASFAIAPSTPLPVSTSLTYDHVASVTVDGGTGNNTFAIDGTPAGVPTTINTGAGSTTLSVSAAGVGGADNAQTSLTINTGDGGGAIGLASTIAGGSIAVDGGNGPDAIHVYATGAGSIVSLAGGGGGDAFTIDGGGLRSVVSLDGGAPSASPGDSLAFDFDPNAYVFASGTTFAGSQPALPGGSLLISPVGQPGPVTGVSYANLESATFSVPPLSASAGGTYTLTEGQPLNLQAGPSGATAAQGTVVFAWDLNGDGLFGDAIGQTASVPWAQLAALGINHPGTYTIALQVTDALGQSALGLATLNVAGVAPAVTVTPPTGTFHPGDPLTVGLAATLPAGVPLQGWSIDWGDGTTATTLAGTATSATHVYTSSGSFTVTASAVALDATSLPGSGSATITIAANQAPVASAGGPYVITEGGTLALDGTGSYDPNPGGAAALSYQWTIGGATFSGSGTANPALTYSQLLSLLGARAVGPETLQSVIGLTVSDGFGATLATSDLTIRVATPAPSISASTTLVDDSNAPNVTLNLAVAQADGSDGQPLHPLSGWTIDWGDGSTQQVPAGQSSVTHAFTTPAGSSSAADTINATATFQGIDGPVPAAAPVGVTVIHHAATGSLTGASQAVVGSAYQLDVRAGDYGGHAITGLSVDWGDGDVQAVPLPPDATTPVVAQHVYASPGPYRITATATDDVSSYELGGLVVQVANPSPSLAAFSLSQASINEGDPVTLTGSFLAGAAGESDTVVVDWGDGSPETVVTLAGSGLTPFGGDAAFTHRYLDNPAGQPDGSYQVHVSVTNADDNTSVAPAQSVTVANVPPTVAINGATSGVEGSLVTLTAQVNDPGPLDVAAGFGINWTITRSLDDGATYQPFDRATGTSYTLNPDQAGLYRVTATAIDKDGAFSMPASQTISIANVAPSGLAPTTSQARIDEGGTILVSGSFADPGTGESHTVTIYWGDGQGTTLPALAPGVLYFGNVAHTYADNPAGQPHGLENITFSVNDGQLASISPIATVEVDNVAPSSVTISPITAPLAIGQSFSLNLGFYDPGTLDGHTVSVDWGDGSSPSTFTLAPGVLHATTPTHAYATARPDGSPYAVTVAVTDKDGASARATTAVPVIMPALAVTSLSTQPGSPITEGASLNLSGTFTDQSAGQAHTVVIDWGDGTPKTTFTLGAGTLSFTSPSHTYANNPTGKPHGSFTITATVTDNATGGHATATTPIEVDNLPPFIYNVYASPSTTTANGTGVAIGVGFSDAAYSDAHTVDINWGDGTADTIINLGPNVPTYNVVSDPHVYAENSLGQPGGVYTVTVTVTDQDGASNVKTTAVTVDPEPPTTTIDGDTGGVPFETLHCDFTALSDAPSVNAAGFTYTIDFGDGTPVRTYSSLSPLSLTHQFPAVGHYNLTATATDAFGHVGNVATLPITITTVNLAPDPADPSLTALFVGGTAGDDVIHVNRGVGSSLEVLVNDRRFSVPAPDGHVLLYGGPGNDNLMVSPQVINPAMLFGGDGDDVLKGGGGPSVLVGGAGDDQLIADHGNDVLIGGLGSDNLNSHGPDSIVIGGSTTSDENPTALAAIQARMSRNDLTYAQRVDALIESGGLLDDADVTDDLAANLVIGQGPDDLFFAGLHDKLVGVKKGEIVREERVS